MDKNPSLVAKTFQLPSGSNELFILPFQVTLFLPAFEPS